jgi:hypothetical protein
MTIMQRHRVGASESERHCCQRLLAARADGVETWGQMTKTAGARAAALTFTDSGGDSGLDVQGKGQKAGSEACVKALQQWRVR